MTNHQHIAAGIDLGSNTFRLLVADCSAGSLKVLAKKMATVGLGRGLDSNGLLHEESIKKGLGVLRSFRETLDHYQPQSIRICGTEALRRAKNSGLFLQMTGELLQLPVHIISGEEEARLCLAGASAGHTEPYPGSQLLVDVGGGSTELVFAASPAGESRVKSVPLGAVRLTEEFLAAPQPDLAALDIHLAALLSSALEKLALLPEKDQILISGCGGTATSLAALDLGLAAYNAALVHGHMLQDTSLVKLWHMLIALPADARNMLPCLGDGRGEILPAGLRIYHILLKLLQQNRIRVSDTGLLEGIVLSSLPHAAA